MIAAAVSSSMPSGRGTSAVGGGQPLLGIGAGLALIGDAVADLEVGDAVADGGDHACPLVARDERQSAPVEAGALVGVDEVEPDRRLLRTATCPGPGSPTWPVLELQDLGAAGLANDDGLLMSGCFLGADLGRDWARAAGVDFGLRPARRAATAGALRRLARRPSPVVTGDCAAGTPPRSLRCLAMMLIASTSTEKAMAA